jgi:hypothetical protein
MVKNKLKSPRTTSQIKADWDREVDYALKHGKRYSNAEDLFKDILKKSK